MSRDAAKSDAAAGAGQRGQKGGTAPAAPQPLVDGVEPRPAEAQPAEAQPDDAQPLADEALLLAFGQGDLAAARALTERWAPRLLRYATRLLGGDRAEAEDVTQEALLRLWRLAPEWRSAPQQGEARLAGWLYRVAGNLCTDQLRRRRRQGPDLAQIPEPEDPAPGPAEALVAASQQAARAAALDAALARLPERQRQAVVLRHIEGLGNPEIARIMEVGIEAVESLTARGKRALAAALAGRREELGYED